MNSTHKPVMKTMDKDQRIAAAIIVVFLLFALNENTPMTSSGHAAMQSMLSKKMLDGAASGKAQSKSVDKFANCKKNGIILKGNVGFVESFGDLKIKFVSSFADINVEFVSAFPDDCGEWKKVSSFGDFSVEVVDSFPDLTVKKVSSFPGMN